MGFRSRLVLAKLGFDLRQRYDDLLGRELPDELGRLAPQLNPSVGKGADTAKPLLGLSLAPVERTR